jgi:hypothetical protein
MGPEIPLIMKVNVEIAVLVTVASTNIFKITS